MCYNYLLMQAGGHRCFREGLYRDRKVYPRLTMLDTAID